MVKQSADSQLVAGRHLGLATPESNHRVAQDGKIAAPCKRSDTDTDCAVLIVQLHSAKHDRAQLTLTTLQGRSVRFGV